MPQQWTESIIVLTYKMEDKTDCRHCKGITVLPTTYKILSNIILSRLNPLVDKIIVN